MAENQKQLFEKGAEIEVRPDDEGFSGSWYEATILSIVPNKKNPNPNPNPNFNNNKNNNNLLYYDVEYKTLLAEDEVTPLKERVRFDFMRPIPPQKLQQREKEFQLDDIVEAFYQDGWWIGVVTKVIHNNNNNNNNNNSNSNTNKEFVVTFTNPPDRIRVGGSELRVHLDWIEGEWVRPSPDSKKSQEVDNCEDQIIGSMKRKGRTSKVQSKNSASSTGGVDSADGQEEDLTVNQMTSQSKSKEKSLQKNKGRPTKIMGENGDPENGLSSEVKTDISRKDKTVTPDQSGVHLSKRQRTQNADSSHVSKEAINVEKEKEGSQETFGGSDPQPLSLWLARACPKRNVEDLTDSRTANGSELVKKHGASAAAVEGNGGEVINPNNELAIVEREEAVEGNGAKTSDSNNPDLEKIEMGKRVSAVEENSIDSNDHILPFVKTFPLWSQIESMQVFQAIPQSPHFRNLVNACPENCREGMAIGYMVTFCSVVKKVNELRLDNSRGSIEDCFDTLVKLEENGFDVKVIRERLSSLLSKKDEHNVLVGQLKEHEIQIMEHNCEKIKMVEEIDEIDKEIKGLLEKRDTAMSMGESVEREISCFESKLKSVSQEIDTNLFNFIQAAASHW